MHPLVRDAYRRLLWAGRVYPAGLAHVRERAKAGFLANRELPPAEVVHAVHKARWWAKELEGVASLAKYRALRRRYGGAGGPTPEEEHARLEAALAGRSVPAGGGDGSVGGGPPPSA